MYKKIISNRKLVRMPTGSWKFPSGSFQFLKAELPACEATGSFQ
jgi:hypothetical protein